MPTARILYQASQSQFIRDVERNYVSQKMRHAAEQAGIQQRTRLPHGRITLLTYLVCSLNVEQKTVM